MQCCWRWISPVWALATHGKGGGVADLHVVLYTKVQVVVTHHCNMDAELIQHGCHVHSLGDSGQRRWIDCISAEQDQRVFILELLDLGGETRGASYHGVRILCSAGLHIVHICKHEKI